MILGRCIENNFDANKIFENNWNKFAYLEDCPLKFKTTLIPDHKYFCSEK